MDGFYVSSPETWHDMDDSKDNWEKLDVITKELSDTSSESGSDSDSDYSPDYGTKPPGLNVSFAIDDYSSDDDKGYDSEKMIMTPPVMKSLLDDEESQTSEESDVERNEEQEQEKEQEQNQGYEEGEVKGIKVPPNFDNTTSYIEKPEPFENSLLDYDVPELRVDYFDRCLYSKQEFNEYYCDGGKMWKFMHPKNVMKRQLIHDAFYYNPDLSNKKISMLVDKLVAYTC